MEPPYKSFKDRVLGNAIPQNYLYQKNSQFLLSPVVYHTHNNKDSPAIPYTNLLNYQAYRAVANVTLTSAQIKALHSTPVTLIPSVTNAIIIVESIGAKLTFASAAYTGANNMEFRYTNGSGTKVTADMSSTFLDSAATAYDYAPAVTAEFTPVLSAPVVVAVPTANPATGNSTIMFSVAYRLLAF